MIKYLTIEVGAYAALKLTSSESAGGFDNSPFAVYPPRFYRIEPGAFARQPTGNYLYPSLPRSPQGQSLSVVFAQPITNHSAHMPGSIVPYHYQHSLAFKSQSLAQPFQVGDSNATYCPPLYETQHHLAGVLPQQAVATQRRGSGSFLLSSLSTRRKGSLCLLQLCMEGCAKRLHHTSSWNPATQPSP